MKQSIALRVLTIAICLVPVTAAAGDLLGVYLGAGLGESEIRRDDYDGPYFNEHNFAWKAFAGIRPIRPVGVELDYLDFGNRAPV